MSNQLKSIFPPKEVQLGFGNKKSRRATAAQRKKKAAKRRARISKVSITGRKENGVQLQGYEHYYSRGDFNALKPDTRAAILQARKDNNYVPGGGRNPGRNIDALAQSNGGDDASQMTSSLAGRTITMDRSLMASVLRLLPPIRKVLNRQMDLIHAHLRLLLHPKSESHMMQLETSAVSTKTPESLAMELFPRLECIGVTGLTLSLP